MKMDVPFLFSILVAIHVCGVLSMSPMMQDMNTDIMKDIMNLRQKIKNHQKTLANKGTAKESNTILPAAEIAMREFFTNDGKTPAGTKTSDKKKPSVKNTTKKDVKIPDVTETLKNVVASNTNTVPVEKKSKKAKKSETSKKTTDTKAKEPSPPETGTGPSDEPPNSKSETTSPTVAKETTKSTLKTTKRSRRRSSRRRKSSRKPKRITTPSPITTTQGTPTVAAPTVPKVTTTDTIPAVAQVPEQSMRTTMTHMFSEGPMLMASLLARVYPQLLRMLGGARGQGRMMDPNMAVMMHDGPFFNHPTIPGESFGQGHTVNPSGQQRSTKKSPSTLKSTQAETNPMQIYMQRELCSETPSRFIKMCKTTMDCKHKMQCYSGYCCASSHRHAEMLDNLPEYIDMPRPQRSWRSFFK